MAVVVETLMYAVPVCDKCGTQGPTLALRDGNAPKRLVTMRLRRWIRRWAEREPLPAMDGRWVCSWCLTKTR
jgi:hypothetical protein